MKKIILFISILCLVACAKVDPLYESIDPSIEEINTVDNYLNLISIANEYEFNYFYFIDLRSSVKYDQIRLSHFKANIDYSLSTGLEKLINYISNEKNVYIILISDSNDNLSVTAKNDLIELGYTNIKDISIGISEFEQLFIEVDLKEKYFTGISCGC